MLKSSTIKIVKKSDGHFNGISFPLEQNGGVSNSPTVRPTTSEANQKTSPGTACDQRKEGFCGSAKRHIVDIRGIDRYYGDEILDGLKHHSRDDFLAH